MMQKWAAILTGATFIFLCQGLKAESLDSPSLEALTKTVELLRDKDKRSKAADENTATRFVDRQAKSISGTEENYEEMYAIAAEIFTQLVKESGGDVNKMKEKMNRAKQNPRSFAEEIERKMPQIRARIKLLSHSVESSGVPINTEVRVPSNDN